MKIMTDKEQLLQTIRKEIKDGATIAVCGNGGGLQEPDSLLEAIETSFLQTGHPKDLTLIHGLGIGDRDQKGINRLAHKGLVKKVIGGHWSWSLKMQKLAADEAIEAYTLPAGMIQTLYREIGAGRPGVISKTGLGTFADPDNGGGCCNQISQEKLVEKIELGGEEYLWYKAFPIDVAIIRGSYADDKGNISFACEAINMDAHPIALAAHNSGGKVFVQVRKQASEPLYPRHVGIAGILSDYIWIAPNQPQSHISFDDASLYEPYRGQKRKEAPKPKGLRYVIARRAAQEVKPHMSINFGFGIPGGVAALLDDDVINSCWRSVEQGTHNGQMIDGALFGAVHYPDAICDSLQQFDFYNGGGVDLAILGMGEMDQYGNVNVSQLGDYIVGPGGFVDISQYAKKVVFCGSFEAKGLDIDVKQGVLKIKSYGSLPKIVTQVRHITFSGKQAVKQNQDVLYVTERAVFRLTSQGVMLIEVAKGIDVQKDIIQRMGFTPLIADNLKIQKVA